MNWRCARRMSGHRLRFELLDEERTRTMREVYASRVHESPAYKDEGDVQCAHCDARFTRMEGLRGHLAHEHAIEDMTKKDYVLGVEFDDSKGGYAILPDKNDRWKNTRVIEDLDGSYGELERLPKGVRFDDDDSLDGYPADGGNDIDHSESGGDGDSGDDHVVNDGDEEGEEGKGEEAVGDGDGDESDGVPAGLSQQLMSVFSITHAAYIDHDMEDTDNVED
ncbi:uncharacterized protein SCHCODRAFT_02695969 [Schizophyllum commune H4-8]|uniref:Expressed protein n=1 Tax=Schizophyllum commune (strain H4-8 / FGSC 9210) TaxID=578458 RepID=D8PTX0_SCHCM|nr:uncharacterized protein SCHCODRAFT_02695969 [Schizophyllum commune H4-8]KAI5900812.1 hypothetical protein SCHCODRAFT_02695969 [Schizophyllum commune H4-8]